MTKRRNWTKVVLIAGALICVTAAAFAHRRGRGWWDRPDRVPVPNLIFNTLTDGGVQTKDGRVKEIVVEGCDVTSKNKFPLDDNAVNGAVVDGEVKVRAMTLTGDLVQVELPVLCATLKPNYFNSKFWTNSTATVTAFVDGARVTRVIPVSVHGSIREDDGTYFLDAEVRGVLKTSVENEEDDSESHGYGRRGRHGSRHHRVTTTETITTFKVVLCAQATLPPLTVMASATDALCNGEATGTADAVAAGGTGPYTYLWSNGATTASISGLAADDYDVTVTDANGDTAMASVAVGEPTPILARPIVVTPDNGSSNGTATVNPVGGTPGYTYLWSDGQTTQMATGLSAGPFRVRVTDANGCQAIFTTTIPSTAPPFTVSVGATDASCNSQNGAPDGTATASPSGGTAPYTYAWSNGATTQMISGLPAGTYSVTVTDANDNMAMNSATVNEPEPLDVTIAVGFMDDGNGRTIATLTASPIGGTAPYMFNWSNGSTSDSATNLLPGQEVTLMLTDDNGCETLIAIQVPEPA